MIKRFLFIFFTFTISCAYAGTAVSFDSRFTPKRRATYFVTMGQTVEITWNKSTNADRYEFELYCFETRKFTPRQTVKIPKIVVTIDQAGHYAGRVRSCNSKVCSKWVDTRNPKIGLINGAAEGWWIYCHE